MNSEKPVMSEIEFAALGDHLAYVRAVPDEEAIELAKSLDVGIEGIQLFSLHGADGRRLAVTDSFALAAASASDHDLETVYLH